MLRRPVAATHCISSSFSYASNLWQRIGGTGSFYMSLARFDAPDVAHVLGDMPFGVDVGCCSGRACNGCSD